MPDFKRIIKNTKRIINPGRQKGETKAHYKVRIYLEWAKRTKNWDALEELQNMDERIKQFIAGNKPEDIQTLYSAEDSLILKEAVGLTVSPRSLGAPR